MSYERPDQAADTLIERSGCIAEADAFGIINTENPEYRLKAEAWCGKNEGLIRKFREHRLSEREHNALFGSAFRLIENLPEYRDSPERAVNPEGRVLNDLRLEVVDALELITPEAMDRVKSFTTVGSVVDVYLGMDGFLRIESQNRWRIPTYVSLDYTINSNKNKTRSDVLIKQLPDPDLAEEDYLAAVRLSGEKAVNQYRRKIEKLEERLRYRK